MLADSALLTKLKSDSFWVAIGFLINATSSLVISMLLTRILDANNVGMYFLAFSVSIILSGIVHFGLNIAVVRIISSSEAKGDLTQLRSLLVKMLLFITLWSGIIVFLFMTDVVRDIFIYYKNSNSLSSYISLVGIWVFFIALRSYIAEVFRGFHDIKLAAIYQRILPNVLLVALIWVLYVFGYPMDLFFIIIATISVNGILVIFALYPFFIKLMNLPKGKTAKLRPIVYSSSPIAIGQILQFIITQTPLWVLGAVALAGGVADYGVAFRLAAIISLPLLIANNVIMPIVSNYHSTENTLKLKRLIQYSVASTSFLSVLMVIVYVIFGDGLLALLFGEKYQSAYMILIIISIGHVFNVLSGSPAIILAMAGKEIYIFYSTLIAAISTFLLSILFIPAYDVYGAAFVTGFGLVFLNIIMVVFCYRVLGYKTYLSIEAIMLTIKRSLA